MTTAAFDRLRALLGPAGVVPPEDAERYLIDERRLYRGEAAMIVRPASTEEVAEVVRICAREGIAIVPQGGNTGYCGGATPDDAERQIVLCLERLNRVREIDPVAFTMTLEAGVVLAKAQDAAGEHGLLFPLSMGSEGSCQIGGNLSTNAGGLAVLKYGTARELVLGLEVVLPSGEVLHGLQGLRKDNTGYDLKSLFMGAEGTLGIITAAVVKLFPAPEDRQTAWLAVADAAAACRLLGPARRASGDAVTSFEYVARPALELVLEHVDGANDPLDEAHQHYVLIELSGPSAGGVLRAALERVLEEGMEAGDVLDGVIAESGPQRDQLWRLRESIPESEKHEGGSVKHDVSVPISRVPDYLERAPARVEAVTRCRYSIYGHIGDGNLHYNLLAPEGVEAAAFRAEHGAALSAAVHGLAAELGGSFSAEHGVGKLKRAELAAYEEPAALELMRKLKATLDPDGLMNPGKVL